jgi:ABC-type proline/glycine betaine transport system permease subunit
MTAVPARLSPAISSHFRRLAEVAAPFVALAVLWQIASLYFPKYLFPPLLDVFWRTLDIFVDWPQFAQVLATVGRILGGLAGAFVIGAALAILMVRSRAVDRFFAPILSFFQGVPALSWVVFAIIWFHGIEFRIFFIMVVTSLPAFTFQVLDALRGMSKERVSIARAFATDAHILLCDEPFSALDEITAQRLREEFVTLVRQNRKTGVFITHSINEALQVGDRIVVLRRPARVAYDVRITREAGADEQNAIRKRIEEILAE